MNVQFTGGNTKVKTDSVWNIAKRHNKKSIELNGYVTVTGAEE